VKCAAKLSLLLAFIAFAAHGQGSAKKSFSITVASNPGAVGPMLALTGPCANASSLSGAAWSTTPIYQCNLPEASAAGDTIVFSFGADVTAANQNFSVSDDAGDTYTLDATSATVNNKQLRVYRATNVGVVHYVQVILNSGQLNGYWNPAVAVFYNAAVLDGSSCNTGTSATITAGSITPTVTGDLFYQISYAGSPTPQTASFTPGSQSNIAWSLVFQLLGDDAAAQYGVYNSTSALNPTFTQAASASFISCALALKSTTAGSAPTVLPRAQLITDDAMPKNAANPWTIGAISNGDTVYLAYVGNDPISSITSSPTPTVVNWTASGADFNGLNGHNHVNFYCAQFSSPPGRFTISLTRTGTTNDSINKIYDVIGGTCNLDADSGGQAGNSTSAATSLTTCSGCITPTKLNDFILSEEGQAFCTAISMTAPNGASFDAHWFQGNNISGPTQTDENNFWTHFLNPTLPLAAVTVTLQDSCGGSAIGFWAARTAAYQSVSKVVAASCSQTDVQATVDAASNGSTVLVPGGGTCNWGGGTVSIPSTKGITLDGGGNTTITGSSHISLTANATTRSRVTGFIFTGTWACCGNSAIRGDGGGTSNATWRIDHNTITGDPATNGQTLLEAASNGPGLIDHNTLTAPNNSEIIHVQGVGGAGGSAGWIDDIVPGGSQMLFVEDNTFTNSGSSSLCSALQSYYGARTVFRHNTLNFCQIDQHGTAGNIGARWWEIYENTFQPGGHNQSNYAQIRAGSGVFFNNHESGSNTGAGTAQFAEEDTTTPECVSGGYPCLWMIGRGIYDNSPANPGRSSPAYYWNNDAAITLALNGMGSSTAVQSSRDLFSSGSQPATLTRCESAADVTAGCPVSYSYVPYTYPHPLNH